MTDDDTKFERAARESRRRWEAVIVPGRPVDGSAAPPPRLTLEERMAWWAAYDELHGVPRDGP